MTLAKIAIVVLVNFEMNKQLGRQLILIPYQSELTNPYLIWIMMNWVTCICTRMWIGL